MPVFDPDFKSMIEVFPAKDTEFKLKIGELGETIMDGFDITALDGSGFSI